MTDSRIEYLYRNCLAGNSSVEEREEFTAWLRLPENEDRSKRLLLAAIYDNKLDADFEDFESEAMIEAIIGSDRLNIDGPRPDPMVVRGNFLRKWGWAAAAAVVLGIIFGGYFLFFRKPQEAQIAQIAKTNDIQPGGNKAILTLSNGSKIMLDSAHNGLLAQQNGTNIIKSDSGSLHYSTIGVNQHSTIGLVSYNTLATPRGGQYQITLPDGTKAWLNAASSITYPTAFTAKERLVEITGEAYFEVKHDAKKPFRIKVAGQIIDDIGTAFNINAYSDEPSVRTTLVEGSVKITAAHQSEILRPGEQAVFAGEKFSVNKNVNLNEVTAWKGGSFHFENADLETILRQFARWYDVEVVYEGTPANRKFFGILNRSSSLKKVLKMLGNNNIEYRIEGKRLIVKSNN